MKKISISIISVICSLLVFCMSCSNSSSDVDLSLIPVKSGDSWGYINPKGEYVINPQFEDANLFYNGLAQVKSDGKVGYIDGKGKFVIDAQYKDGTSFSEGLAFVVAEGGHPTCIDTKGKTKFVLEKAKYALQFTEGLAIFQNNEGKCGFVDKSGKEVIAAQFTSVNPFSEQYTTVYQDGKWGFIGKDGKLAINPQFERVYFFSEGKAAFYNGKKWGYVDPKGQYLISPQFDDATPFYDGLAAVEQGDKWGYIDAKGKYVINPQFDLAYAFAGGLAVVKQGKQYGYINKKGQFEINPQFEDAGGFVSDITPVKSANQYGFIDKKGKYVITPQFDDRKFGSLPLYKGYEYVASDFYDTSEFIDKFFERAGNNSFDGFNVSSTLQNLIDNPVYGNGVNADYNDAYLVNYKKTQQLTSDISISKVEFNSGYGNPFYTGSYYNKEYNFGAKIISIRYVFKLSGEARNRDELITNALIAGFEKHCNIKLEYTQDESGCSDYGAWYSGGNEFFEVTLTPEIALSITFK